MSDSRRQGVVIVGAGLMGQWHAHALRAIGRRIAAVVDPDADRAAGLARRYAATGTTDFAAALGESPLAVHLCTPRETHLELAERTLAAGAHVLIEKPFAHTGDAATKILSLAAARNLIACPVHQFLYQRGVRHTIANLAAFGPILHADFVACSAGATIDGDTLLRRAQLALDILPHPLSLLRRVLAMSLPDAEWHVMTPMPGEVRITGSVGQTSFGMLVSAAGRPTRNTARFVGERGTMHIDLFHGFATFEPPDVSRARKIARPFALSAKTLATATANLASRMISREPAYPGLRELVAAFYDAIASGAGSPITPAETKDVAVAADRIAAMLPRS